MSVGPMRRGEFASHRALDPLTDGSRDFRLLTWGGFKAHQLLDSGHRASDRLVALNRMTRPAVGM
jgi:hypothetical protein